MPSEDTAFSQDITAIHHDPSRVDRDYLMAFLRSQEHYFASRSRGATIKGVTREAVADLAVPLPPLDEQRRIATILDQADALCAKRRQSLAHVDDLTQSTFLEMFGDPTAAGSWPLKSVADIAAAQKHAIVDGPFGSALKPSDYEDQGVPVIRIKNISRDGELVWHDLLFINPSKFDTLRRSALQAGDVLVSRVGTLGNTCVFPSDLGDALLSTTGVCKVSTDRSLMLPEFLHAAIRTVSFQRQIERSASTSVQKYFNLSALRAWRIIVPPISEQLEFVDRLLGLRAHRALLLSQLEVTKSLHASLQHSAFAATL
jgi:type I restriction enzyme S subunit